MSDNNRSELTVKFSVVQEIINSYILSIEESRPPVWGYSKSDVKKMLNDLVKTINAISGNKRESS